jgi:hypothetical protein
MLKSMLAGTAALMLAGGSVVLAAQTDKSASTQPATAVSQARAANMQKCVNLSGITTTFTNTCDQAVTLQIWTEHTKRTITQPLLPGQTFRLSASLVQPEGVLVGTVCPNDYVSSVSLGNKDAISSAQYDCVKR